MTHDPLCPNVEGTCCPWMGECNCQCLCDWIEEIRVDERQTTMTKNDVLEICSVALFKSWFPNGHGGHAAKELQEDFENWVDCAIADATAVVDTLIEAGLLSVSDSAMIDPMTKDERN